MKKILISLLIISCICTSCRHNRTFDEDRTAIERIKYVYHLKQTIDDNVWSRFNNEEYDIPLIYYMDSVCYVANPTEAFLNNHKTSMVFKGKGLSIFRTELLDSIPFHMEVNVTFDDGTEYNRSPFIRCSSVEITQRIVPDVNSTEEWTTMIMHEYFHGFQFKNGLLDYFENSVAFLPHEDTLQQIYKANEWYRELVDQENKALLSALEATEPQETDRLMNTFFKLREERKAKSEKYFDFDILKMEEVYETMEGTARYIEYSLYDIFASKDPDKNLKISDPLYKSNSYFKSYNFDDEDWLYDTGKSKYFFVTGFNLCRILDKLNIV